MLRARVHALELQGLDRFTRFAFEHLTDAAYWMNQDASIIHVNEAACALMGYSSEELQRLKIHEFNVDLSDDTWPAIWGLLKAEGHRTFEARHRHKDGRILDVEVRAHFVDFDGEEYSCAFVRDIGERKELELRLRQAEKMEAIGQLAGGIAHDFNNQLASIMGYSELLGRTVTDNARAMKFVRELGKVAQVAADLTSQLLAFSRRGKFRIEPIDLHRLLEDEVLVLSRSLAKNIRIETELNASRAWTLGDPSQLQNALLNLALNARDAMPHGGTLTLSTANVDIGASTEQARALGLPAGSYVELSVRDTGVGMDRELQQRVFEPFFTTKDVGSGTGLGLSAVYGTVKNHKGAIAIESEVGRGTRFVLYLPTSRSGVAALADGDEPASLRLHGHILVVEDEPALRVVSSQMLQDLGCRVTAVADGDSAIQVFRELRGSVDLVLLDLVIPGTSAMDTLETMRQVDPSVQVIVMSGYSRDGQVQAMLDAGAKDFLAKPFNMATLAGKVGALLPR